MLSIDNCFISQRCFDRLTHVHNYDIIIIMISVIKVVCYLFISEKHFIQYIHLFEVIYIFDICCHTNLTKIKKVTWFTVYKTYQFFSDRVACVNCSRGI